MANKTAVEWLIEQLEKEYNSFPLLNAESCIQAKEIEKQQIIDAYETSHISMMTAEQYYNETFKSE